jgi:hypothetical protein
VDGEDLVLTVFDCRRRTGKMSPDNREEPAVVVQLDVSALTSGSRELRVPEESDTASARGELAVRVNRRHDLGRPGREDTGLVDRVVEIAGSERVG